jgi:hypothetical protein
MVNILFRIGIFSFLFAGSSGTGKLIKPVSVPVHFFKDSLVLDTTFLFEITEDFNTRGDRLYGSLVALIKPDFPLTKANYLAYKTSTINFIYSGRDRVDYSVRKQKLNIIVNTDSPVVRRVPSKKGY